MKPKAQRSESSSLSLIRQILGNSSSNKRIQNFFQPKPRLKLNLLSMASPKEILDPLVNSSKSLRVRKALSKNSLQLKPSISCLLSSSRQKNPDNLQTETFDNELTEFEREEVKEYPQVYYLGTKGSKLRPSGYENNSGFDAEDGSYKLVKHDHLGYRFEIISFIGRGSFGIVCECLDHKSKEKVAVKIINNKKCFHKQATIEISILKALQDNDVRNLENVIKLKYYFVFRNHICLVFDLLGMSLYHHLKNKRLQGLSSSKTASYTIQILKALSFLASLSIIHCDLKPENLLLTTSSGKFLTLIDFGSSCYSYQKTHDYIQSRYYRAPEIILEIPYTCAIDMWSLGCIVAEMHSGKVLLKGDNEVEQLMLMIELLGLPDEKVLMQSRCSSKYFRVDGSCKLIAFQDGRELVPGRRKLEGDKDIMDFVLKCLQWDSKKRMSPLQALGHPWLKKKRKKSNK